MVFMAVLDVKILEETYLCKISGKIKPIMLSDAEIILITDDESLMIESDEQNTPRIYGNMCFSRKNDRNMWNTYFSRKNSLYMCYM